jgi:hypothetical protein
MSKKRPRKPSTPIMLLVRRTNKIKKEENKLVRLCHPITPSSFHNLSSTNFSKSQSLVLSLGMKFIPKPPLPHLHTIIQDFDLFARRVRLRFQFLNAETSTSDLHKLIRTPNPLYKPPKANTTIEQYLTKAKQKLIISLSLLQNSKKTYYHDRQSIFTPIIQSLQELNTIVITLADKNMGVTVVDKQWYVQEVMSQLQDRHTYTQLTHIPSLQILHTQLITILQKFKKYYSTPTSSTISPLASYLLRPFSGKNLSLPIPCSYFYLLIKLHKPPPTPVKGRPIVASMRSVTYYTSKYLDYILQPVMKTSKSYLHNSFDIIQHLESTSYPPDTIILTGDVNSLYPSINIEDGIIQIRKALKKFTAYSSTEIEFFLALLSWVLYNNYIEFGDTKWIQIKGTAMGTPVAVAFANIYLTMLEIAINEQLQLIPNYTPPLYYKRFIDDLIAFFKDTFSATSFSNMFNTIRRDTISIDFITSDSNGTILDITLKKGIRFQNNGYFDISLFQKHCNKYLYIPPFSYHQKSVFKGFITSELKRYRIHCSNDSEFAHCKSEFYSRLLARGYNKSFLDPLFTMILHRPTLITARLQKAVSKSLSLTSNDPLLFTTTFSPLHKRLNFAAILDINDNIFSDPASNILFSNCRPITAYKKPPSLRNFLMHARFKHLDTENSTTSAVSD